MNNKKIFLPESEAPKAWYNIMADMPNKPLPPLHPKTMMPAGPEDLAPLFPMSLIVQEVSQERFIDIPDPVLEAYKVYRPTPLIRATGLEKALDTPAKIYYKYEGVSPSGSHKPNTAIPQAYYNSLEGVRKIATETGAGQWGTALSYACQLFGLECEVFMVNISYKQKPYRKHVMNLFGSQVHPSPSNLTQAGKQILAIDPDSPGSLGIAISEAVERAVFDDHTKYALGSVLNHVLLHQTVIGLEAKKQMEIAGDYPDLVIAPLGGGSNFAGLAFPFLHDKLSKKSDVRCIAVEPASCPKLTRGVFKYDFGDATGMTPLLPMFTLGHDFMPPDIHAGGLRYHGASVLCSQLLKDGIIEANALQQIPCFESGILFAKTEGIVPAPEANHAIAQVVEEAIRAREEGTSKTILFNLCGHGHFDMEAYKDFFAGKLYNHDLPQEVIDNSIEKIKVLQPS